MSPVWTESESARRLECAAQALGLNATAKKPLFAWSPDWLRDHGGHI